MPAPPLLRPAQASPSCPAASPAVFPPRPAAALSVSSRLPCPATFLTVSVCYCYRFVGSSIQHLAKELNADCYTDYFSNVVPQFLHTREWQIGRASWRE